MRRGLGAWSWLLVGLEHIERARQYFASASVKFFQRKRLIDLNLCFLFVFRILLFVSCLKKQKQLGSDLRSGYLRTASLRSKGPFHSNYRSIYYQASSSSKQPNSSSLQVNHHHQPETSPHNKTNSRQLDNTTARQRYEPAKLQLGFIHQLCHPQPSQTQCPATASHTEPPVTPIFLGDIGQNVPSPCINAISALRSVQTGVARYEPCFGAVSLCFKRANLPLLGESAVGKVCFRCRKARINYWESC
jgi:hypothetical protein